MFENFISEWKSEIAQTLAQSKSLCLAIYSVNKTLLFCNEAFSALISDDPCSSLINPTFDNIISFPVNTDLVFSGFLTIGNNYTVSTSIFANIYRKEDKFMIIGGIDIIKLLEQNKTVLGMNSEINKLQREIISKNKQLEKTNQDLDKANKDLIELNQEIITINEELKTSYEEISTLNENLNITNENLLEANATKDKFFSIIAHDLKSPFSTIIGFSDLLLTNITKYNADKIEEFVTYIHYSSKSAYALLENLLVWARSQSGKIRFNPTDNNLSGIIKENITLVESQATKKGIKIFADHINFTVFCDKDMINTVIRNLLTNAIKFTQQNGQIIISAQKNDNEYEIIISDTGIGISPENIQKLFTINSKYKTPGTDNEKGTGLGLILCKEFVEKHGGQIWVESIVGKGSDFKFTLPVKNK